jgi:hypothetical protein
MGGKGSGGHNKKRWGEVRALNRHNPIYNKQRDETAKAWHAFTIYRDLGVSRTQIKVAAELGKKPDYSTVLSRWSTMWSWVERAAAWDAEVDRRKREGDLKAIEKMRERHIQQGMAFQGLAAKSLQKYLKLEDEKGNEAIPTLSPDQVAKLADLGIRLERLNRGEPEKVEEIRLQASVQERREHIQEALKDPEVQDAMKVISMRALPEPKKKTG